MEWILLGLVIAPVVYNWGFSRGLAVGSRIPSLKANQRIITQDWLDDAKQVMLEFKRLSQGKAMGDDMFRLAAFKTSQGVEKMILVGVMPDGQYFYRFYGCHFGQQVEILKQAQAIAQKAWLATPQSTQVEGRA